LTFRYKKGNEVSAINGQGVKTMSFSLTQPSKQLIERCLDAISRCIAPHNTQIVIIQTVPATAGISRLVNELGLNEGSTRILPGGSGEPSINPIRDLARMWFSFITKPFAYKPLLDTDQEQRLDLTRATLGAEPITAFVASALQQPDFLARSFCEGTHILPIQPILTTWIDEVFFLPRPTENRLDFFASFLFYLTTLSPDVLLVVEMPTTVIGRLLATPAFLTLLQQREAIRLKTVLAE
jgi:hypothetical protein